MTTPEYASLLALVLQGDALSASEALPLVQHLPGHMLDLLASARLQSTRSAARPFTCAIVNAKSGSCSEDCRFCAQSRHYPTGVTVYPLVGQDDLLRWAERYAAAGVNRMGIVISGARPTKSEFERLCQAMQRIQQDVGIGVCASLGLLTVEQGQMLREAGCTRYHHNLETARSHYPSICTTHAFEKRMQTVRNAREAGLEVCSGGLFGLGESWEQRVELASTLTTLDVNAIPINFLTPIQGTPLGASPLLPPEEALCIIALFRLMHPGRDIIVCGGRTHVLGDWAKWVFAAGANGLMTGDYLTTKGGTLADDRALMERLGLFC